MRIIGVRGGGRGGGRPPGFEKFQCKLCFQGKRYSCSKILDDKKIFQYSEKFQGNSVFQGKRKLLKSPECRKYIQHCEKFQGNSVFQSKRKLLKILNVKSIHTTVKIFRATLFFFQGKRKLLKNREL